MPEGLVVGLKGLANGRVSAENTAERFGNAGAAVFATPMLTALMEQAAIDAIKPYLLPGEGTVGTKVDMVHMAATPVGMNITAEAILTEVSGKKLTFEVTAGDDKEKVGTCRHERYVINDMSAFLAKVAAKGK